MSSILRLYSQDRRSNKSRKSEDPFFRIIPITNRPIQGVASIDILQWINLKHIIIIHIIVFQHIFKTFLIVP